MSKQDATIRAQARDAGITLTRQGEPLFARDLKRFDVIRIDVQTADVRTPAQKYEDSAH